MFAFKPIKEQTLDLRRENAKLKTNLDKTNADMEYIAMMTDVELDTGSDETEDDENNEQ